jgi:cell filamentation protein
MSSSRVAPRSRYQGHGDEAEHEPGSRGRVLRNLLGVHSTREISRLESERLLAVTEQIIDETEVDQSFTAADLGRWHRTWLGEIYPWAGEYRHVNLARSGFMFAAAEQVPRLMHELERGPLARLTPCRPQPAEAIANALAVVHAELILIHPFREGNGRLARLLATLMALQAGLPPLDFGGIRGQMRRYYFAAIQASMGREYAPISSVFERIIARTVRTYGRD